eukprot:4286427-Prorocentrum_lima.AAC.1
MKVWKGWNVAHQLAVLPDVHNYHLPLMGRLALSFPKVQKRVSLPTEDHVLAASLHTFSLSPLKVGQSLPLSQ